ncbi:hypothetical protein WMY93_008911 [Mugilogobius chulae]|uniref:SET domain-containing protein n=1 Tax=Mugilogobius chulae TaxID=88201 RepID=A0AAW0PA29_9GOBI
MLLSELYPPSNPCALSFSPPAAAAAAAAWGNDDEIRTVERRRRADHEERAVDLEERTALSAPRDRTTTGGRRRVHRGDRTTTGGRRKVHRGTGPRRADGGECTAGSGPQRADGGECTAETGPRRADGGECTARTWSTTPAEGGAWARALDHGSRRSQQHAGGDSRTDPSTGKGRGIFTSADFKQGDFVVEYRGELIDAAEAEHRRNLYHNACSVFMFDFIWKRKTWCIDGALEDGSFGRLVNDEHRTPNCKMKLIEAEGKPHLCLFALKEILAGTEITYDYGGKEWPWRKELKLASIPSGQQCVAEHIAHDVEPSVISTDSFTGRELRSDCQSSRPTEDSSEHEEQLFFNVVRQVHSLGGQCGTSSLKELIGEVGVQFQELSPHVFLEELTSETESKVVRQSSRAVPNDSVCELKIASIPSGQQCVAEHIAHDVEPSVISTDSFTGRELRSDCQSSRPTEDSSEHENAVVCGIRSASRNLQKTGICPT